MGHGPPQHHRGRKENTDERAPLKAKSVSETCRETNKMNEYGQDAPSVSVSDEPRALPHTSLVVLFSGC